VRRIFIAAVFLAVMPVGARAQDSTAVVLQRARDLYEQIELERALPLYRSVVSSGWRFAVSQDQRVEANLYLGAALELLGQRDSALVHFRAALERDPFADLDPARFTPAQLEAFQAARRTVFAIGVRPAAATRFDPRTGKMTFTIATSHAASVRCEIRRTDQEAAFPIFVGEVQGGLREIEWNGLLSSGQLAPTGRYAFVLLARSRVAGGPRAAGGAAATRSTDSTAAYFDVSQEHGALEDTLPDLGPADLLAEQYRGSSAAGDLLKGLGIAAGALLLANVASNDELGAPKGMAATVGVVGVTVGIASVATRHGQDRPANIAANERRRSERAAANAEIRRRNAERLAQTVLSISPAAGRSN
jgi:tetratricopeptide (TPR) repeat protein